MEPRIFDKGDQAVERFLILSAIGEASAASECELLHACQITLVKLLIRARLAEFGFLHARICWLNIRIRRLSARISETEVTF